MEIWKDIKGYVGLYQVSNYGRVKSLDREVKYSDGRIYKYKGKILSDRFNKYGYKIIDIGSKDSRMTRFVHRLVAEAFLENPNKYNQINYKDEDKTNNSVDNLEWCDCKYNINYGTHNERVKQSLTNGKLSKYILQIKDETVIKQWESLREIERALGYSHGNISLCCNNSYMKRKNIYKGYEWRYAS